MWMIAIVPPPIACMIDIIPPPIACVHTPAPMTTTMAGAAHCDRRPPTPQKTCNGGRQMSMIAIIINVASKMVEMIVAIAVVVVALSTITTTMTIAIVIIDAKTTTVDGGPQGHLWMFTTTTQEGW
jgi:hypothetical protein